MSKKIIDSLLECGFITIDEDYAKDMTPQERKDAYDELIDEVKQYYPRFFTRTYQLKEGKLGLPVPYEWNGDQSTEILIWTDYDDVFEYGVDSFVDLYESDQDMLTSKGMEEIIDNGFTNISDEELLRQMIEQDIDYYESLSLTDLRSEMSEIDDDLREIEENLEFATNEYDDEVLKYDHYQPLYFQTQDLIENIESWVDNTYDSVMQMGFPLKITNFINTSSQFKSESGRTNLNLYVPFERKHLPYTINEFASLMVLIQQAMDLLEKSVNPSSKHDDKLEKFIFTNVNDSRNFQQKLEDRVQALSLLIQADLDSQALFQKMRFNDDFNKIFIYMTPYAMIQTILSNFGDNRSMEDIYLSIQALLDYDNTNGEYYNKGREILEILGNVDNWNMQSETFEDELSIYGRFTVALFEKFNEIAEENFLALDVIEELLNAKELTEKELDEYDPYSLVGDIIRGRYEGETALSQLEQRYSSRKQILEQFGGADLDAYGRYVLRYQLDENIASHDHTIHECEDIYYIYV